MITNWSNYPGANGEVFTLPSLTIPGQSLSLKTLLERYVKGGAVAVFPPVYSDDPLIPDDLERMDEIERIEFARGIKTALHNARSRKDVLSGSVTDPQPGPTVDPVEG